MHYTSWGIIIDDIVFPDGRTTMGVLGGGGMYAVAGMRMWSEDVGMLSHVGADFDSGMLTTSFVLYRNQKMLGTGGSSLQHRLHHQALRCFVVR